MRTTALKVLWEFKFQADKQLLANQPDIIVADKEQKTTVVINVAIPVDSNIRKKRHEKMEKYYVGAEGTIGADVEGKDQCKIGKGKGKFIYFIF